MKKSDDFYEFYLNSDRTQFGHHFLKYTYPLYRSIGIRLHDNFKELIKIGVIGEGPSGLAAVLSTHLTHGSLPHSQNSLKFAS